jgi:hypothetical protein
VIEFHETQVAEVKLMSSSIGVLRAIENSLISVRQSHERTEILETFADSIGHTLMAVQASYLVFGPSLFNDTLGIGKEPRNRFRKCFTHNTHLKSRAPTAPKFAWFRHSKS